jgi:hypothetical protein
MRILFSVLGLLVVVAVVGLLARKQLVAVTPAAASATAAAPVDGTPVLVGTPKQQVQQFKNALDATLQQARPMPDDK